MAAPSATSHSGGYTETFGGTSAASPVVAGVAGWILSVRPDLTASEVRSLFVDTAHASPLVTFDETGHHPIYGFGELDLEAIRLALFPEAEEQPGGCGCALSGSAGGPRGFGAFALVIGVAVVMGRTTMGSRRGRRARRRQGTA